MQNYPSIGAKLVLSLLLALTLSACSYFQDEEDEEKPQYDSERQFYEAAQRQLDTKQWERATKTLQALEENFPFGKYAEQAQLELIYAYYKSSETEAASAAADRFIRLHPQHRNVDYAYYMKGLSSFSEGKGLFERFLPTDLTRRDPGSARESFTYFSQLIARFPNSNYAPDAEKRMIYLRNLLARYEIHVANYYFKRGAYVAATNRGRYVVENFQKTPAVPDGLAVTIQGYHALGMDDLAETNLAILKENYPEHPAIGSDGAFNYQFHADSGERGWLSKVTFGFLDKQDPPGFDSRAVYNPAYKSDRKARQAVNAQESSGDRPWYHKITFGIFE
ncbi:outer membrane protein assembly factor BamD [Pseudoteredinibacter isoporae]|uniref:outer membrane protein assembly factor BamD n=1 Tax=Pseudoteredinibacter isoporae TaxID=570281 RepID=UPI003101C417